MPNHVNFSEKPEAVTFTEYGVNTEVSIVLNIQEIHHEPIMEEEEERVSWEGDQYIFWELTTALDKEAILANPEAFITYVPVSYKNSLKDKAQQHLDYVRDHTHRVDVPTYKEGYAVMHREKDDINLLAGLLMGGLPYYEFADGQTVAPLSPEDIQKIYTDLAAHEIGLQQHKQACWAAIDAATTQEEADAALQAYIQG
jgi:hypothetical protein